MIDDDNAIDEQVKSLLDGENIGGYNIRVDYNNDFDTTIPSLKSNDYDILVLDLFRGTPSMSNNDRKGEEVIEAIKKQCFIPVIFFSGLVKPIEYLKSDVIRVVRKGDSVDQLTAEIASVLSTRLPVIKRKINIYLNESMRSYFWDFVQPNWKQFEESKDDVSLGYLLIRKFANSLSKEQIIKFLDDPKIKLEKSYPMEFYIIPPPNEEFETGDILKKDDSLSVLLTPSCDFVKRKGKRDAEMAMLVKAKLLKETEEYKSFKADETAEKKNALIRLIEDRKSDRYFFLPGIPFMENHILDFQNIAIISFGELAQYKKFAKLDDPFAQSMLSKFIRYYNRIGHEDIDSDYIMDHLE